MLALVMCQHCGQRGPLDSDIHPLGYLQKGCEYSRTIKYVVQFAIHPLMMDLLLSIHLSHCPKHNNKPWIHHKQRTEMMQVVWFIVVQLIDHNTFCNLNHSNHLQITVVDCCVDIPASHSPFLINEHLCYNAASMESLCCCTSRARTQCNGR